MPKGPAPQWTAKKAPFTYDHIQQSVECGLNEQTGHYGELLYTGCEDEERAKEIKRSLYRCAKQLGFSMKAEIEPGAGSSFQVRFKAIDKTAARAYVRRTYGNKMPYNPYAKNPPKEDE
jgi:hypothetical protein